MEQTNTSNIKLFFGLNDNKKIDANETLNDIVEKLKQVQKESMQRKMNLIKNKNIKKPILGIKNNNTGNNINESSINNSNYYNSIINNSKIYIRIKLSKKGIKI